MPSVKRFRLFWIIATREPRYHAAHLSDVTKTLCKVDTAGMKSDEREYQLPPPKVNCFKCLTKIKDYWPEKGSYYGG